MTGASLLPLALHEIEGCKAGLGSHIKLSRKKRYDPVEFLLAGSVEYLPGSTSQGYQVVSSLESSLG